MITYDYICIYMYIRITFLHFVLLVFVPLRARASTRPSAPPSERRPTARRAADATAGLRPPLPVATNRLGLTRSTLHLSG